MNLEKLQEEITYDEGCIKKVYLDHLGLPTCGIGHLILESDIEYGQPVGFPVSDERVTSLFKKDIAVVMGDCEKLFNNFFSLPEEAQRVIANMMFNLGFTRLNKFNNFKKAVKLADWNEAADQMIDSQWYRQVPIRAKRLVERIRKLA